MFALKAIISEDPGDVLIFKNYKKYNNQYLKETKKSAYDDYILKAENKSKSCWNIINFENIKIKAICPKFDLNPNSFNDFFFKYCR